jgi:phosphoglycerol transferase MdoB-like AlkP superfamily enzyme
MINHLWTLDTTGCNVLNENVEKETLSDYLEQDGILAEVNDEIDHIQVQKYGAASSQYNAVLKDTLNLMVNCSDYVDMDQPTFTMVYMCCPHSLFVLDENGNYTEEQVWRDLSDTKPYVNQLIYTNECIEKTITNIKEKDPDALIIIQSDHGGRYPYQMYEEYGISYDTETETSYMQNILNCVYYKGNNYEIEGLSGINTLRMVINEIFGTDYEMLENPKGYLAKTSNN